MIRHRERAITLQDTRAPSRLLNSTRTLVRLQDSMRDWKRVFLELVIAETLYIRHGAFSLYTLLPATP